MAPVVKPNYVLASFEAINGYDGGFPRVNNITVEEVLLSCSTAINVLDFLFATWPDYYLHKDDMNRLLIYAMRWSRPEYLKPLTERMANIHLRYDSYGEQVCPMLQEVLRYNVSIATALNKRIKLLTNSGASLFDTINNRYIFEFLNNQEEDKKDVEWYAQQQAELPSALKARCRTLLFTFATVAFKIKMEGIAATPTHKQVSAIMDIEPVRNIILDYII